MHHLVLSVKEVFEILEPHPQGSTKHFMFCGKPRDESTIFILIHFPSLAV